MLLDHCKPSLPLATKKNGHLGTFHGHQIFFYHCQIQSWDTACRCVLNERLKGTDIVARSLQAFTATRSKKNGHHIFYHCHHIFFITATFTVIEGDGRCVLNERLNSTDSVLSAVSWRSTPPPPPASSSYPKVIGPGIYLEYAPMIYMALYLMFLMRADPLRGQVGGGWVLEIWRLCSLPFQGPKKSICTHQKHYARGRMNHRCMHITQLIGYVVR